MSKRRLPPRADLGQSTAIAALSFLGADPDRLARFLSVTGLGPHNLRQAATGPGFLVSVLDYLAADERLLLAFAADQGLGPEDILLARDSFGGASPPSEP